MMADSIEGKYFYVPTEDDISVYRVVGPRDGLVVANQVFISYDGISFIPIEYEVTCFFAEDVLTYASPYDTLAECINEATEITKLCPPSWELTEVKGRVYARRKYS